MSILLLDQQEGQLKWNVFDAQTGELTTQKDLIRLRSTWGSRGCCENVCTLNLHCAIHRNHNRCLAGISSPFPCRIHD